MVAESVTATEYEDWHTATEGPGSASESKMTVSPLPPQAFRAGNDPHDLDVFIAVMGMSGAGKSTFISHFTNSDNSPEIGKGLQSCTQKTTVYRCNRINAQTNLYLIDTPSFDNTHQTDAEVLDEISQWLAAAYANNIKLRGILYLRRITEARVRFSEMTSLQLFRKLCGPKALRSTFLVSTMWDATKTADGNRIEAELAATPEFWGSIKSQGATIKRHAKNTKSSAMTLVKELLAVEEDDDELVLDIQDEMVNAGKACGQTRAGKVLECEFAKQGELFTKGLADITEALRNGPHHKEESALQQQQQHREIQQALQRLECQQEELVAGFKTIALAGKERESQVPPYYIQQTPPTTPQPTGRAQRRKMEPGPLVSDSNELCLAAEGGKYDELRRMLDQGADPAMCGRLGWTALHWAADNGRADIVKLLLFHRAPVDAVSDTGVKPLNMAKTNEIKKLLLDNGATY
ncbi:hypothetical protein B0T16DRAFT_501159, partial [Cercophora newfieldiana]